MFNSAMPWVLILLSGLNKHSPIQLLEYLSVTTVAVVPPVYRYLGAQVLVCDTVCKPGQQPSVRTRWRPVRLSSALTRLVTHEGRFQDVALV